MTDANTITVYVTDPSGVFLRAVALSRYAEQPEHGVYVAPPTAPSGQVPVWTGSAWGLVDEADAPVAPEPDPDPVPIEIEGWQAEVAMRATPVYPDDLESQSVWDRVQDLIAAMPAGVEKITAQTVLARGKIRRDSSMLAQLAPLVPLTQERVDDMLRLGDSIQA